jgi:hypothetical protein
MSSNGPTITNDLLIQQKLDAVRARIARLRELKDLEARKAELLAQKEQIFQGTAREITEDVRKIVKRK